MENDVAVEWVADLGAMTCRNIKTGMVFIYVKYGQALFGRWHDMPEELFKKIFASQEGVDFAIKAEEEAGDVFFAAYYGDKNGSVRNKALQDIEYDREHARCCFMLAKKDLFKRRK
jgi:hypothetical protein